MDSVNQPFHYRQATVEVIDTIRAHLGDVAFISYCRGNALKYICRAPYKGSMVEDLRKASWYLQRAADVAMQEAADGPEGAVKGRCGNE